MPLPSHHLSGHKPEGLWGIGKVVGHRLREPFVTYENLEWETWGGRWDLNPQPSVPQTDALTS